MSANNVSGVSAAGQRTIVENVGAKRILGTELVAIGKMPNWVYYLVDIDSICVYANQGADVWIGAFGQPVAGSQAIRDSLTPFEGQKFYVIDTDISYTYKGGAWEGGVVRANTLAPTWINATEGNTIARGRSYVVTASGNYIMPPKVSATLGDTLEGHYFQLLVERGVNATLLGNGSDTFINNVSDAETSMDISGGTLYTGVYMNGEWEIYYLEVGAILQASNNLSEVDPAAARTNLDVPSNTELEDALDLKLDKSTSITVDSGITKTGTLSDNTIVLGVDFASPAEAADVNNEVKVINPKTLAPAVSSATRSSQYNNITGLLPKSTETKFLMTANVDRTKVDYPEFTVVFNPDPYLRTQEVTLVTFPAGQLTLPAGAGVVTKRAVAHINGTVTLEDTVPEASSVDKTFLGSIVVSNGEVGSTPAFGDQIFNVPWLASSESTLRTSSIKFTGGTIAPSATVGQLRRGVAYVERESGNWENSTLNPHKSTLGATDPITFTYLNDDGSIYGTIGTSDVDGRVLTGGVPVANNKYSIQVAYITTEGLIIVLLGQVAYDTMSDTLAQIENYLPVKPSILDGTIEFSRWAVKGTQHAGNINLDLNDSDKFVATSGSQIEGGTSGGNAADIVSSTTNNDLASTNLQEQLNELAERTLKEWEFLTTPAVQLTVDSRTFVENPANVPLLPATIEAKDELVITLSPNAGGNMSIANPNFTIIGAGDSLAPTDKLILEPGNTAHLLAVSATTLKVV